MTQRIRAHKELSQHTTPWTYRVTEEQTQEPESGVATNVFFADFDTVKDIPLPDNFKSISDIVERNEQQASRREALERARRSIGDKFYADKPETIAALRLSRGWSQKQLGDLMGTSQPHIARIESGREDVRLSTIRKIASVFEVPDTQILEALDSQQRQMNER